MAPMDCKYNTQIQNIKIQTNLLHLNNIFKKAKSY